MISVRIGILVTTAAHQGLFATLENFWWRPLSVSRPYFPLRNTNLASGPPLGQTSCRASKRCPRPHPLLQGPRDRRPPSAAGTAPDPRAIPVSYTHLRAHETDSYLVC